MKNFILILILISTSFSACNNDPDPVVNANTPTFPVTAVNLGEINSIYDDFNSASPFNGNVSPLCFSTNRASEGANFDIIYKLLDVLYDGANKKLIIGESNYANDYLGITKANANLVNAVNTINSSSDELGPYLIPQGESETESHNFIQNYILLYATNKSGNLDIKLTGNLTNGTYSEPQNITFLNSPKDDAYPTLNADKTLIYFCSNRENNFDIYETNLNNTSSLLSALTEQTERAITKNTILSSDYDDKCPFINGDLMVFTSNRPGGFGGFDLYYSIFKNGEWSNPVNFGNKINTQYDEYRPIVKAYSSFTNDFMIFSSNRPGGKGGFDLYYVGIDKMTGW
jgi:hypothetical protein